MIRRKRVQAGSGVQMFPFLDALICTMGALLVLLHAFARHGQVQAVKKAESRAETQETAGTAGDLDEVKWRIGQLQQVRETSAAQLADERLKLSHIEDHERRLREKFEQLRIAAAEMDRLGAAGNEQRNAALAELAAARNAVGQAQQDVANARRLAEERAVSYSVVPFEGPNSTRRRPIYIECLADAVVIQPEGIVLTPQDFAGFLGPGNPLASELRGMREYYAAQATDPKQVSEPYPLLLVRPEGIEAYHHARAALDSWGSDFGYELVGADWKLKFPEPDPRLSELMRQVLADARVRQREYILSSSQLARNRPRQTFHASARGGFVADSSHGSRGGGGDGPDPYSNSTWGRSAGRRRSGGNGDSGSGGSSSSGGAGNQAGAGGNYAAGGPGGGQDGSGTGGPDGLGPGGSNPGGTGPGGSNPGGGFGGGTSLTDGTGTGSGTAPGAAGTGPTNPGSLGSSAYPSGGPSANGMTYGQYADGRYGQSQSGSQGQNGTASNGSTSGNADGTDSPGGTPGGSGGSQSGGNRASQAGTNNQAGANNQVAGGANNQNGNSDQSSSTGQASGGGQASSGGRSAPGSQSAADGQNSAGSQGSSGGQAGSSAMSSSGSPGGSSSPSPIMAGGPPPKFPQTASAKKTDSMAKTRGRDWGLPDGGSQAAAATRPILVECHNDRLVIMPEGSNEQPKVVKLSGKAQESMDEFVSDVWKHMKAWCPAGKGVYWRPTLLMEGKPGAADRYAEVKSLLADSGLDVHERQPKAAAKTPAKSTIRR